ncbi:hypothetical protein ccbrp13_39040 [Ktedonobacteria bacterium brp13]|jgi:hypothetical protein|nr:hypothetical protein ccbrp13_39040 [Ktedonobacteria bacterium brp13]
MAFIGAARTFLSGFSFGACVLVKRSPDIRRGIGIGTALLGAVLAVMQDLANLWRGLW